MASSASTSLNKRTAKLASKLASVRAGPSSSISVPRSLTSLELTFAKRNSDYGARKFVQRQLPSLKYANPWLQIAQNRAEKVVKPEMILKWDSGEISTISLEGKQDETIREELKDLLLQHKRKAPTPAPSSDSSSPVAPPQAVPTSEPIEGDPTKSGQASGEGESSSSLEAGVDYGTARQ